MRNLGVNLCLDVAEGGSESKEGLVLSFDTSIPEEVR